MMKVHQIDAIGFLTKRNGDYIRWEPYHIKQMGTISDGNPTGKKGMIRAASYDAARYYY